MSESPAHIITNGFQPPPKRSIPASLKSQRTRKRLSMSITSIPIVHSSDSISSPVSSRSPSISCPRTPGHLTSSSISAPYSPQVVSPGQIIPDHSKSSIPSEAITSLNDALMNKSHRPLHSRSVSLSVSTNFTLASNPGSQPLSANSNAKIIPPNIASNLNTPISLPTSSSQSTITSPLSISSPSTPFSNSMSFSSLPSVNLFHDQQDQPCSTPSITSTTSTSTAASSAIEYYFSQLAYRERRIVELRDEIKRMQQKLKRAEDDLECFKQQVPTKDLVKSENNSHPVPSSQTGTLKRASSYRQRLINSNSPRPLDSASSQPQNSSNRRSSYPVHGHVSTSSNSSTYSTSGHSNSLSSSSASSMNSSILEETDEDCNTTTTTSTSIPSSVPFGKSNTSESQSSNTHNSCTSTHSSFESPLPQKRTHRPRFSTDMNSFDHDAYYSTGGVHTGLYDKYIPPDAGATDQVLHMGKRVVEELGSQFWSFIEDIKNVAVGEDARDPTNPHLHFQHPPSHHGKSKSLAINQSLMHSSTKTHIYPSSQESGLNHQDPFQNYNESSGTYSSASTSIDRISSNSMNDLHVELVNNSNDIASSPRTKPDNAGTTNATSFYGSTNSNLDNNSFSSNIRFGSASSICAKGMALETGSAIPRHRTRNSISLGRSVSGSEMTRRLPKKTCENSYYII